MNFSRNFFAVIFCLIPALAAQALPTVEKGLLSSILPNVQILFDGEKNLPVFVRVASIASDGECQEPSSECEQNALYVVISDNEKLPVTSVTYGLGKARRWDVKSVSRCSGPNDELCAKITLDQDRFDAAARKWQRVHHIYEFRMDSVRELGDAK